MASGVIRELGPDDKPFYDSSDVMQLLGISKSKACQMIHDVIAEMQKRGCMGKGWPQGKVPKWLFRKYYMLDEMEI